MPQNDGRALPPGSTIGILGGGQLGRMLALAAARLGLKCHIYCPDPESPAFDVAAAHTIAAYEDAEALDAFARAVDVVTYEFENVDVSAAERIGALAPVRPGRRPLAVSQDRLIEKSFLRELGIATAPFAAVDDLASLESALESIGRPARLKTRRLGYDGKGQAVIGPDGGAAEAWAALGGAPAILEAHVAFEREISIIAVRGLDGTVASYDVAENEHRGGILFRSIRSRPRRRRRRRGSAAHRRGHADRARLCRRHRHRVLRRAGGRGGAAPRQRICAARAQFRPLDAGCRARLPVREPHPRDRRLAARHDAFGRRTS